MALPWLRILDTVLGLTDLARGRRLSGGGETGGALAPSSGALGHLETRLAGVVVSALKEAFDRDTRRLELEREQIEAERRRVERALKLELLRQAGEREIGRMRLVAAVAVASWIGTLLFAARVFADRAATGNARVVLAVAWLSLLAALGAAFAAQSRVGALLARTDEIDPRDLSAGISATLAPWLVVVGLALVGVAVLI